MNVTRPSGGSVATKVVKGKECVPDLRNPELVYHRWGVLAVVIDGVVSECENENYDCYSRMEYRSLPRNYVLSLTLS